MRDLGSGSTLEEVQELLSNVAKSGKLQVPKDRRGQVRGESGKISEPESQIALQDLRQYSNRSLLNLGKRGGNTLKCGKVKRLRPIWAVSGFPRLGRGFFYAFKKGNEHLSAIALIWG